jgi:hypothetical protein
MRSIPLVAACAIVRAWTCVYTWRLPAYVRDARRAEIASDLWECRQDPAYGSNLRAALHVLLRLLLGVPDDLEWRVMRSPHPRLFVLRAAATTLVLLMAWVWVQFLVPQPLPKPPLPPMQFVSDRPEPPPAPPPPH